MRKIGWTIEVMSKLVKAFVGKLKLKKIPAEDVICDF